MSLFSLPTSGSQRLASCHHQIVCARWLYMNSLTPYTVLLVQSPFYPCGSSHWSRHSNCSCHPVIFRDTVICMTLCTLARPLWLCVRVCVLLVLPGLKTAGHTPNHRVTRSMALRSRAGQVKASALRQPSHLIGGPSVSSSAKAAARKASDSRSFSKSKSRSAADSSRALASTSGNTSRASHRPSDENRMPETSACSISYATFKVSFLAMMAPKSNSSLANICIVIGTISLRQFQLVHQVLFLCATFQPEKRSQLSACVPCNTCTFFFLGYSVEAGDKGTCSRFCIS